MTNTKTILLVEDDFYIRDIYCTALESRGFNVITAVDGKQAIKTFGDHEVDMVLLDIMLPQVNGVQVLKHIRQATKHRHHTPVVIFTNVEDDDINEQVRALKPEIFLIKSAIKIRNLVDQIERMLETDLGEA